MVDKLGGFVMQVLNMIWFYDCVLILTFRKQKIIIHVPYITCLLIHQ